MHRIGRTGRAGSKGKAITFICADERPHLRDIERFLKKQIPVKEIGDYSRGDSASLRSKKTISIMRSKKAASQDRDERSFNDSDKRASKQRRAAGAPKKKSQKKHRRH